jgi:hypothetical protein
MTTPAAAAASVVVPTTPAARALAADASRAQAEAAGSAWTSAFCHHLPWLRERSPAWYASHFPGAVACR